MSDYSTGWWLLVIALGGLGAATRYIVDTVLRERCGVPAAIATATINVIGAFAAGVIARPAFEAGTHLAPNVLVVGFLGGFTTYSTAMVDTWQLWSRGKRIIALVNTGGQLLVCTVFTILGFLLAEWWPGSH